MCTHWPQLMNDPNSPAVSVIIPTFNRKDMVSRLIDSIVNSSYKDLEIIVVDDCSTDGTPDHIRKNYPGVHLTINTEKGYLAGSRNNGAKMALGRYLLFIDDDNELHPKCIEILSNFMDGNPKCGICGPFIYYFGKKDVVRFAGVTRVGALTKIVGLNMKRERVEKEFPEVNASDDIPNSLMVRREIVYKYGIYFDRKNFPIHYDESDFAKRAISHGYQVFVLRSAETYHDENIVFGLDGLLRNLNLNTPMRAYYTIRGKMMFHKIYSSRPAFIAIFLVSILPIALFEMTVILVFAHGKEKMDIAWSYLKGIIDGFLLERE
jgi:GT2 family glycosyltransferase